MPGFVGFPELIVLAIVLLLIFGPKRLPEIGRSVGRGLREFRETVAVPTVEPDRRAADDPRDRPGRAG